MSIAPRDEDEVQELIATELTQTPEIIQPEGWAHPRGYSNGAVATGRFVTVAGQVGWNPLSCMFDSDDFAAQTRQTLLNIAAVLKAGGAGPEHMVRMTWYVVDRVEYIDSLKALGGIYREVMGKNFPAMTCVQVAGLVEERARVEIEVTAVVPD